MSAAEHCKWPEDVSDSDPANPELAPATERLEDVLGGDLTRFLLAALTEAHAPSRDEPR